MCNDTDRSPMFGKKCQANKSDKRVQTFFRKKRVSIFDKCKITIAYNVLVMNDKLFRETYASNLC